MQMARDCAISQLAIILQCIQLQLMREEVQSAIAAFHPMIMAMDSQERSQSQYIVSLLFIKSDFNFKCRDVSVQYSYELPRVNLSNVFQSLYKFKHLQLAFLQYNVIHLPLCAHLPQYKFCIIFVFNFAWVLQSSQEQSKTVL